jgi:chorismate dehydratase
VEPPEGFEISRDPPSVCAEKLSDGRADVGLIPSIEFRRIPNLRRIEGLGIAADSEVRSVLLVSKVARGRIRRLKLDPASRTSASLVRILLRRRYGIDPEITPAEQPDFDAELVIGDPALKANLHGCVVMDLAAEWKSWTGFPFVFAFWAVRDGAWRDDLPGLFRGALDYARERFGALLDAEMELLPADTGLSRAMVEDYLEHCLHFELSPSDEEGLSLFYRFAQEDGLIG